jgi:hypothetical protein
MTIAIEMLHPYMKVLVPLKVNAGIVLLSTVSNAL